MRALPALLVLILQMPLGAQATMEQLFYCTDGESGYDLYLSQSGQLQAQNKDTRQLFYGTYSSAGNNVSLNVPGVFVESSMGTRHSFRGRHD